MLLRKLAELFEHSLDMGLLSDSLLDGRFMPDEKAIGLLHKRSNTQPVVGGNRIVWLRNSFFHHQTMCTSLPAFILSLSIW